MYLEIREKFNNLENRLFNEAADLSPADLVKLSQEHASLKKIVFLIDELEKVEKLINDNQDLIDKGEDKEIVNLAQEENNDLISKKSDLEGQINEFLNPSSPNNKKNAIIEIRAGTGGDEAALFAEDLFRIYSRYADAQSWKLELIDANRTSVGGFKEVIFNIKGEGVYGVLKFEGGTHRVQRVPETEKQGRVHTSTATVVVLPEAEEVDIEIKANDIRVDTFCSSGPGGQSVNTTHSAIRILHIPTGIIVSCQDQKSQHQNKEKAMQVLRSRLLAKKEEEEMAEKSSARKSQIGAGDRSDKIRTYNFPQDRITDHRVNQSWHNINSIMEGDLEPIILALKNLENDSR